MSKIPAVPLQAAVILIGLAMLMAWPPVSGTMMLVTTPGVHQGDAIDAVTAAGGTVLGAGPFGGSIVVTGDRARIARATSGLALLIVAAPPAMCGADGRGSGS